LPPDNIIKIVHIDDEKKRIIVESEENYTNVLKRVSEESFDCLLSDASTGWY